LALELASGSIREACALARASAAPATAAMYSWFAVMK
jgi:hypothetical protein